MAKAKKIYVCQECGAKSPKWLGQCPSCEAWNTFVEEKVEESASAPNIVISSPAQPLMSVVSAGALPLLLYMAFISAGAYSLWSILLKYNPVSRVTVFGFMNPVIGVILSALILGEQNQAFTAFGLGALALVSLGIIIVNRGKPVSEA